MPATKTARTLLVSQTLAAGASVNAGEWDLRAAYGGLLTVKLTNGSSGPTTPPIVRFFSGESSGVKRQMHQVSGDTVANSVSEPWFDYPMSAMFANVTITNGATNPITVEVFGQETTDV